MKKALVIRLSSIGDIVLTSALVRCLYTGGYTTIDFCTKDKYKEVALSIPYIHQVIASDNGIIHTAKSINNNNYDIIIDLHNKLFTNILKYIIKTDNLYIWKKNSIKKQLYVWTKNTIYLPQKHIVEQYFDTTPTLPFKYDGKGIAFTINYSLVKQNLLPNIKEYVVFVLGATHFTKRLPIDEIIKILQTITYPIVLLGGNDVIDIAKEISNKNKKCINLASKTNINTSAYILNNALCVYTHDTGMMHIAAALGCNLISFWAGTSPELGFYPLLSNTNMNRIIQDNTLNCKPCSKYGRNNCPKGHFNCAKLYDKL